MFRNTRKYVLRLMLGALMLPAASCNANGKSTTSEQQKPLRISGQHVTATDERILSQKLVESQSRKLEHLSIGERVVALGKMFLETPYVGGTLEVEDTTVLPDGFTHRADGRQPSEDLVINARGLDCVTFYETALGLARAIKIHKEPTLQGYYSQLEMLRYRDNRRWDFASRLHYSSDYFFDNEKRGTMRNVTQEVGGSLAIRDNRRIDFMSTHPKAYKQIRASADQLEKIKMIEEDMHLRGGYLYIPKSSVATIEKSIQNGDIIGITTSITGLDMSHTGIAVRGEDGVVRFMHASSALNKVVISEGSLSDYLAANGKQTGIVVMRPLEVIAGK